VSENDNLDSPNREKFDGAIPIRLSRENIFPPMHSAISAFATKKEAMNMNSFVGLSFNIFLLITWLILVLDILKQVS